MYKVNRLFCPMQNQNQTKAICDTFSFIAMVFESRNAHIELPKHFDIVLDHIRAIEDACGSEVAEHVLKLINLHMHNLRMRDTVEDIANKWRR